MLSKIESAGQGQGDGEEEKKAEMDSDDDVLPRAKVRQQAMDEVEESKAVVNMESVSLQIEESKVPGDGQEEEVKVNKESRLRDMQSFLDVAKVIEMTCNRSEALRQCYKTLFEGDLSQDKEADEKVKILINNLCQEIRKLFLVVGSKLSADHISLDQSSGLTQEELSKLQEFGEELCKFQQEDETSALSGLQP